jgi:hypothetical protein
MSNTPVSFPLFQESLDTPPAKNYSYTLIFS